jgi:hypothetical protein
MEYVPEISTSQPLQLEISRVFYSRFLISCATIFGSSMLCPTPSRAAKTRLNSKIASSQLFGLFAIRDHPVDITKILQNLVSRGVLMQDGQGHWTQYYLSPDFESVHKEEISTELWQVGCGSVKEVCLGLRQRTGTAF